MSEVEDTTISMECLECGSLVVVKRDGLEAQGILNVFCRDAMKDCEDRYAFKQ